LLLALLFDPELPFPLLFESELLPPLLFEAESLLPLLFEAESLPLPLFEDESPPLPEAESLLLSLLEAESLLLFEADSLFEALGSPLSAPPPASPHPAASPPAPASLAVHAAELHGFGFPWQMHIPVSSPAFPQGWPHVPVVQHCALPGGTGCAKQPTTAVLQPWQPDWRAFHAAARSYAFARSPTELALSAQDDWVQLFCA